MISKSRKYRSTMEKRDTEIGRRLGISRNFFQNDAKELKNFVRKKEKTKLLKSYVISLVLYGTE